MKKALYDVKVTISVSGDEDCAVSVALTKVPREKILTVKLPLAGTLELFENSIEDNSEHNPSPRA